MVTLIFVFSLFGLTVAGLVIGTAVRELRNARWQKHTVSFFPLNEADVSPQLRELMLTHAAELTSIGFEHGYWVSFHAPLSGAAEALPMLVLYHRETGTHAAVSMNPTPERGAAFVTDFISPLDSGELVYTSNGTRHLILFEPPGYLWEDPYLPTVMQQWHHHRARLQAHPVSGHKLSLREFCDQGSQLQDALRKAMATRRDLVSEGPNTDRLTFRGCLRIIGRVFRARNELQRKQGGTASAALPPQLDVIAHDHLDSTGHCARVSSGWMKLALLVGSLLLFMLSFGYRMDTAALVTLVVVLCLHEGGHLLAMRLFGYQQLQIFFIPFFGALASGRKQQCTPLQHAIICLAGPVPGLLLAAVLWFTGFGVDASWMNIFLLMLVFINFFNLLPIQPLDGGQLANALLFQRWPWAQTLFVSLSVAAFLGMAWLLNEPLLGGIGLMLAATIVYQHQEAKLLSHVRQHYPLLATGGRTQQLEAIYASIGHLSLPWPFSTRFQAARKLIDKLQDPLPRPRDVLIGMFLYLAFLVGTPVVITAGTQFSPDAMLIGSYSGPDWSKLVRNAGSELEKAQTMLGAGQFYLDIGKPEEARRWNTRALTLLEQPQSGQATPGTPSHPYLHADALLQSAVIALAEIAEGDEYPGQADELRLAEMQLYTAAGLYRESPADRYQLHQLARVYETLSLVADERGDIEQSLIFLKQEQHYLSQQQEPDAWRHYANLRDQAFRYARLQDHDAAIQLYRSILNSDKNTKGHFTYSTAKDLTTLYLDIEDYRAAIALLDNDSFWDPDIYWQIARNEMRAWALYRLGDYTQARNDLNQAIAWIDQRRIKGLDYSHRYDKANNLTRLLLIDQLQTDTTPRQTTLTSQRLLDELDQASLTLGDYRAYLDRQCECRADGYQLARSLAMRDAVFAQFPE